MSEAQIDRMAAKVAVAMNGGAWETHYTEAQKELWRSLVCRIVGATPQ